MISLRSFTTLNAALVIALSLSGCADNATNPLASNGLRPSSANFNSSKTVAGTMDSRVLLSKAGDAILEVHTGSFVDGTNVAAPAGTFSSLTYTIKKGTSTVATHTVSFNKTASSYFVHLDLCASSHDDDDDDDNNGGSSSCSTHWTSTYKVSLTAKLEGLGSDGKSSGTASGDATVLYLPDIDLTNQALSVVGASGALTPANNVTPAVPTTFSVPFPNNKPIVNGPLGSGTVPNAVGVQTTCLVTVDGQPQLPFPNGVYNKYTNPNAFGYTGSVTQNIAAGASSSCDFTLSLPVGTHKIVVTAIVLYPGDYDLTNNSTTTFTVNAVAGPPNIAAAALQQQPTAGGAIVPLGSVTVTAGTSLNLVQWVSLTSGAATAPVGCTLKLKNTTLGSAEVVYTGSAPSSSASCVVPVTFPTAGTYSITSTVTTPAGVTDPDLSNNTITNTLIVSAGPPSATVTVGDITYADLYNSGAANLLTAAGAAEDTVHAGDLVTYTADLNLASFVNTSAVNVTCKVMEGTTDLASRITWVTGPTLTAATAGQKACVFKLAFDETDNASHKHTITVSVTTPGSTNNAASASLAGTISDVVRVHTVAAPLQRVGNGVNTTTIIALDTTKQNTNVTFQTVISNATTHATKVDCVMTANPLLQLLGGTTITGLTVPANGTAVCQFQVKATTVGVYPLSIAVTPSAGAPLDPIPATGHVAVGNLSIVSTGAFTSINLNRVSFNQMWVNAENAAGFPPDSLVKQELDINQMALLVVPAQQTLGHFTLSGHVINGATSYPIGTVSGFLTQASTTDYQCNDIAAPGGSTFANAPADFPRDYITYAASVCSAATIVNGQSGFQSVAINFNESMVHAVKNPLLKYVWGDVNGGSILVQIDLDFTLNPGGATDHVSATIRIPFDAPGNPGGANGGLAIWNNRYRSDASVVPTP